MAKFLDYSGVSTLWAKVKAYVSNAIGSSISISTIKVNGTAVTPDINKAVDITVPTDNQSLTNGAGYQTATDVNTLIDAKLTSAIIPKGSTTFSSLPNPAVSNLGWMYNVTDAFVIDSKFVEYDASNPKSYPGGTNVLVVNTGNDVYKYDVQSGFIDLSTYYNTSNLQVITATELDEVLI